MVASDTHFLRVFVLTGNYFADNTNLGDLAIYESLVSTLPPSAEITFASAAPHLFRSLSSRVTTVPPPKRRWLFGASWKSVIRGSDLVIASGGGYFSDLFPTQVHDVLDGLSAAIEIGVPTSVLGPAFEPLGNEALKRKARRILPRVNAVWTRDAASARELAAIGVPDDRVETIADPAIGCCFGEAAAQRGETLGLNLRDSRFYNPLPSAFRSRVQHGVRAFLATQRAEIVSLPVSLYGPTDHETTIETFPEAIRENATTVQELLQAIGRCRALVCGSHHGALLALGMGVPVVMVAASSHYIRKLGSLSALFGPLASLVDLSRETAGVQIATELERMWDASEGSRQELRDVGKHHAERGQSFVNALIEKTRFASGVVGQRRSAARRTRHF